MYQTILCLVALNEESGRLLSRAQRLAETLDSELHLLHVVEYVPLTGTEDAMLTAPVTIGEELEERARKEIGELAGRHGLADDHCRVISGDLITELRNEVERLKADLVVVGNHKRKGLAAIFDHAEDAVLHRCECDMLAVHLG